METPILGAAEMDRPLRIGRVLGRNWGFGEKSGRRGGAEKEEEVDVGGIFSFPI